MPVEIQQVVTLSAAAVTAGEAGLSTVGEPTIANNGGGQILMAGNWYAARSVDAGTTWEGLDPYNYLNPGPPTRFCCDQTVFYDGAYDLTLWLLQYRKSATDNTLRITVKRGTTLGDDDWSWWELSYDHRRSDLDQGVVRLQPCGGDGGAFVHRIERFRHR